MRKRKISIIVPTYNCERYISECLRSLVSQTYEDLEIVVVDDGSTDGTSKICDEWKRKDQRIKVIHTNNRGVSHARNVGLAHITGNYVGFVDADDWVDPDTYELLLQEMIDKNADVSGGGYIREEKNGGRVILRKGPAKVFSRDEILCEIFSCDTQKLLYWSLCDKLYRIEFVKGEILNESVAMAEDMLFFWKIMQRVKRFAYIPLFKYHYRMRIGSAVHSGISASTISSMEAVREIWQSVQMESDGVRHAVWGQYVHYMLGVTRQMLVYDPNRYAENIVKNQKEIRGNIRKFIGGSNGSILLLLGIVFLCLPFSICRCLRFIIKNNDD